MKKNRILAISVGCIMAATVFSGCNQTDGDSAAKTDIITAAGHLYLSVNPEIKVSYNNDGLVTEILGVNEDGKGIVSDYDNYIGKECREVVSELVEEIHEAGYFVEEVEVEQKKIVIELEEGSEIPDDDFLDDIGEELKKTVASLDFGTADNEAASDYSDDIIVEVKSVEDSNSDYSEIDYDTNDGNSDYDDTDYDPDSNAIEIPVTSSGESDYGTSDYDTDDSNSDYGTSDYDTDDSNSDYGASDYDTDDSNSDYGTSDYDTDNSNSDYGTSDYDTDDGNSDYGVSDYDTDDSNSDYSSSDYDDGESDYTPVQIAPSATQVPSVNGNSGYGDSNYDNGDSDYDNGSSDYEADSGYDADSDYGSSDYDD